MTMRYLVFNASKDDAPQRSLRLYRCYHGRRIGVMFRWNMRCYLWLWQLCK